MTFLIALHVQQKFHRRALIPLHSMHHLHLELLLLNTLLKRNLKRQTRNSPLLLFVLMAYYVSLFMVGLVKLFRGDW